MQRWWPVALLAALAGVASASEVVLDQGTQNSQRCSGMYSRASWGGSVDPFILVKFLPGQSNSSVASLIVFEWSDSDLIGRPRVGTADRYWKCDANTVRMQLCNDTQVGEFLLAEDALEQAHNSMVTTAVHMGSPAPLKYLVRNTGYYCVMTEAAGAPFDYQAVVEFRNAYGELPAAQIPKLPFYGALTLFYAVMGIFWAFLYVQNRHDILAVQNYITAILVFIVVEMLMTWGYYNFENIHGSTVGAKAFMMIVAILNAFRNAFSFFLLLIVCMGYGVVKPSLGRTMLYVRGLAGAHFVFCAVYSIASMVIHPEEAGAVVLLVVLPLSSTLTAFYIWTLNSLNMTMKDLVQRKQHVKAGMYRRLWWCILTTIIVIFGFFFLNSFMFVKVGNQDFAPTHWRTRWFVLDGWLNIVYLADVAFIAYLWRPTPNNRRFAMSDEIGQDDEGFEINSVRDSLESDVEVGAGAVRHSQHTPPGSGPSSTGTAEGLATAVRNAGGMMAPARPDHRAVSPLPAPKPTRPASVPRASLDGETIFAVGEDEGKWSDESDGEEHGLVGKR